MSSTEITSVPLPSLESSNDAVFSSITQAQALQILERNHGGLVAAMWAPVRNLLDWATGKLVDPKTASNVIDARNRFNRAVAEATANGNSSERSPEIPVKLAA